MPPKVPILEDLAAVLAGDQTVYLRLGPEGAVMSVKAPDCVAYGDSVDVRWRRMAPEERADFVVGWIRKAAAYCRHPRIRWGVSKPPPFRPQPA